MFGPYIIIPDILKYIFLVYLCYRYYKVGFPVRKNAIIYSVLFFISRLVIHLDYTGRTLIAYITGSEGIKCIFPDNILGVFISTGFAFVTIFYIFKFRAKVYSTSDFIRFLLYRVVFTVALAIQII